MADHHSSAKDKLLEIIKAKKTGQKVSVPSPSAPKAATGSTSGSSAKKIKPQRGKITSYKANALVVVPNRRISLNIENILKSLKIDAESVENGEEALQRVGEKAFKLILVEKELPDIGGFNLCTKIRTADNGREALIVITSDSRDPGMKMQAQMVDANDYLPQPVNISELTTMVDELLAGEGQPDE